MYIHVGFVIISDFLDPDVVFGVDEGLGCAVGMCESHHTCYVLELCVIVHFHLHTEI